MSNAPQTYEGWSNRSTWNVNLVIMNEHPMYDAWLKRSKDQGYTWSTTQARSFAHKMFPSSQGLDSGSPRLSRVNYSELAEAWTVDAKDHQEHA